MLCDDPLHLTLELQNLIVNSFPAELQKDSSDQGIPITPQAIRRVLVCLGLAKTVHLVETKGNPELLLDYLRKDAFDLTKVILCSTATFRHCYRIEKVDPADGLTVMNPFIGSFEQMSDKDFIAAEMQLLVCDAQHFPGIPPL